MDKTFADVVRKEGEPITEDKEKETPVAPQAEETKTEDTPAEEGETKEEESKEEDKPSEDDTKKDSPTPEEKVPFHKHPRWKQREREWEERLEKTKEEIQSEYEEKLQALESKIGQRDPVEVPSWFQGTEEQYQDYLQDQKRLVEQAEERAVKRIEQRQAEEKKAVQEATEYFEKSVDELEEEGNKVDKNKLLKFVMDNELVDTKGRWNYRKGYELMSQIENAKGTKEDDKTARKKVASKTTSEDKPETPEPKYATPDTFKGNGRPW